MARLKFPANAVNTIARHIFPSAYGAYEKWSTEIWDRRLAARLAARKMMDEEPERAHKLIADLKAKEKAATERLALELYDKYNPQPDIKINVSKAECLRLAARQLQQ